MADPGTGRRIDFAGINRSALRQIDIILARWLPGGNREGEEYVVRNPLRNDQRPGSFRINVKTGAWGDFATGDRGKDLTALAAYLHGIGQGEAARRLAAMLSLDPYG